MANNEGKLVRDMEFEEFAAAIPLGPYSSFSDDALREIYDTCAYNGVEFDAARIAETWVEYYDVSDVINAYDFLLSDEPDAIGEQRAMDEIFASDASPQQLNNGNWLCFRV